MNLFIIERYINKITKNDIYNYAKNIGVILTNNEVDTIYYYLKTYYRQFLTNPSIRPSLLAELKNQVSKEAALKIDELYNQYQNKI